MKKTFLALVIILSFMCTELYAHQPSEMKLAFDSNAKILTVTIKHKVINPKTHYIKKVVVKLNGKAIYTHNIKEQEDAYLQVLEYPILNAKFGDEVTVEAYCNQGGEAVEDIDIFQ